MKHDVIAFLTHLAELVGPEARSAPGDDLLRRHRHRLHVQLVRAADLLIADLDALLAALKRRALEHR